jgi:hypothetical protein
MKANIKILAPLLILSLLSLSARAIVVFQDNFNYPNGTLTNSTWVAEPGSTLASGVSVNNNSVQISGANNSAPRAYYTNGLANFVVSNVFVFGTNCFYFPTNAPLAGVYFSYTINVSSPGPGYYGDLSDTNFDLVCRTYAATNTATSGFYRLGVGTATTLAAATNSSGTATNIVQQDLSYNSTYTIVGRYLLASGLQTIWVNPASEATSGFANQANATYTGVLGPGLASYTFRSTSSASSLTPNLTLNSMVIGTAFADVVPSSAGSNPPFITVQPQGNSSLFIGNNFTNSVVTGGDAASYQWYSVTNSVTNAISGGTGSTLVLSNVQTNQSGLYYVIAHNSSGSVTSSVVTVQIFSAPIAPGFTSPTAPVNQTNIVGDTATLAVVATGVPPPVYKWFSISNNVTNAVAGSNITGTNAASLVFAGVTSNEAGVYFCRATNLVGTTNSPLINFVVNPIPFVNISTLRSMVNTSFAPTNTTSLFTIEGIVTTWTNLTTSGNSEFFVQDGSAAIEVFWSGAAASTNLPPGGALVKVTGAMSSFDGLLELEPVFANKQESVVIVSTNNPLPTPQALPFDPNIVNNNAQMFAIQGAYFVASNVTFEATPPTFTFEANEPITNNIQHILTDPLFNLMFTNDAGDTFTIFYNENVNFLGQAKPTGPVTIYGILSYFKSGGAITPAGWEFTPTRGADIISYINITNVLSNLVRKGDQVTNNFSQTVLEPGETLTTYVSIADPEGGNVTLTPNNTGLPSDANWSGITSGATGTGVFTFNAATVDQSSNYVVTLNVTSTSGNNFSTTFTVYVPTPDEQQIYITEVFASPTTNVTARGYNPLMRGSGDFNVETNIPAFDQYVEIANLSSSDTLNLQNWTLGNGFSTLHKFNQDNSAESIAPQDAFVVYGGPANNDPSYPNILGGGYGGNNGYYEPINPGESLSLSASGGYVTLYNRFGDLVDRVVYPASSLNTSFSRFPTLNDALVPQAYISTNYTTAGLEYDGSVWGQPTKVPVGVTNLTVNVTGTNTLFTFPVNTPQAYTLWNGNSLFGPFNVIYGQGPLPQSASDKFTNGVSGPIQFYFMTTQ